jgi:hypothetical protein
VYEHVCALKVEELLIKKKKKMVEEISVSVIRLVLLLQKF